MDQYGSTGSTTPALTALIDNFKELLRDNQHVNRFALDFSKAFDTVRHSYLTERLAEIQMSDCAYNWIIVFLEDRGHCIKFHDSVSTTVNIDASIVQGSGL